jgi:outer membrane protein
MMLSRFSISMFCAAVMIGGVPSYASDSWSLARCVDYAVQNNLKVQQQNLSTDIFQNQLRQSKAELLPAVTGLANQDFRFGRSIDPYTNGYQKNNITSSQFSLGGRVTLFNGLQNVNTIRQRKVDLRTSAKNEEYLKNTIVMEVVNAYLTILYNQEMVDVLVRQLAVTQLQIDHTRALVEAGTLAHGNLLELSALAAKEDVDLLRARNQKTLSLLTLQQLLELDTLYDFAIAPLELPDVTDEALDTALPDLYRKALLLPEVQSGEFGIQSATYDYKIQRGRLFPTLTFDAYVASGYSGAYKKYQTVPGSPVEIGYLGSDRTQTVFGLSMNQKQIDYPFGDQFRDNANTVLSLQLTVPLFTRLQTVTAIQNARISVEQKRLQLESIKKKVLLDLQTALNDTRASMSEYRGNIHAFEAMQESFRYTEEKFNVGIVTSVDYHNAKNLLSKAESDVLQAKYRYFLSKSILEILSGKKIALYQ